MMIFSSPITGFLLRSSGNPPPGHPESSAVARVPVLASRAVPLSPPLSQESPAQLQAVLCLRTELPCGSVCSLLLLLYKEIPIISKATWMCRVGVDRKTWPFLSPFRLFLSFCLNITLFYVDCYFMRKSPFVLFNDLRTVHVCSATYTFSSKKQSQWRDFNFRGPPCPRSTGWPHKLDLSLRMSLNF